MKIYFIASSAEAAQSAYKSFVSLYGQTDDPATCDVIVILGGDGFMIRTLLYALDIDKPVYGINCGHYGHLLSSNTNVEGLVKRIKESKKYIGKPFEIVASDWQNNIKECFAINEAFVCNHLRGQLAKLSVHFSEQKTDRPPLEDFFLWADGCIFSTPIGSSGYNFGAWGPIINAYENKIVVAPNNPWKISGFKKYVIDPCTIHVSAEKMDYQTADLWADNNLILENIAHVKIRRSEDKSYTLLLDPETDFDRKNQELLRQRDIDPPRNSYEYLFKFNKIEVFPH